eukprot:7381622-Prymnesium_polylepis.2
MHDDVQVRETCCTGSDPQGRFGSRGTPKRSAFSTAFWKPSARKEVRATLWAARWRSRKPTAAPVGSMTSG